MEHTINTNSISDRLQLLKILFAFGFKWHGENTLLSASDVESTYSQINHPGVHIELNEQYMAGTCNCGDLLWPRDMAAVMDILTNNDTIKVDNVGDYNAVVYKDKVEVGCQIISKEKFDEISAAFEKLNS